jgi:protein O-mannosyl-transferase
VFSKDKDKMKSQNLAKKEQNVVKKDYSRVVLMVALVLCSWFSFIGALNNDFVSWDDPVYVEENPFVLNKEYDNLMTMPVSLNYHPVTMISLAMHVEKGKAPNAKSFISVNILFHTANTLLVFLLILGLTNGTSWIAFFTALVFCIHPTRVESVAWISERKDVLYSFFFLISCLTYLKYINNRKILWLVLTFIAFLLSVLSKSVAVVLPLVYLLFDYYFDKSIKIKYVFSKLPFFIFSIFFGLIALDIQAGGNFYGLFSLEGEKVIAITKEEVFTIWQRLQIGSYGFFHYLKDYLLPFNLCTFYPYPIKEVYSSVTFILLPVLFIASLGSIIYSLKKNKIIAFGSIFYLITIVVVLQFISVGLVIKADRYTYIPYIGISFLIFGLWWSKINQNKNFIIGSSITIGLICLLFIVKTKSQIKTWKNSETLWSQVLKLYPEEDFALSNRGNHKGKIGNISGAIEDFEKALVGGCEVATVYEGLGNSYGFRAMQDQINAESYRQKAVTMFNEAIKLNPLKASTYYNKGITLLISNPQQAVKSFLLAMEKNPTKRFEYGKSLNSALINAGYYERALQSTYEFIQTGKADDVTYYQRGLAYQGLGENENALKNYQQALSINPNNNDVKRRLGMK